MISDGDKDDVDWGQYLMMIQNSSQFDGDAEKVRILVSQTGSPGLILDFDDDDDDDGK